MYNNYDLLLLINIGYSIATEGLDYEAIIDGSITFSPNETSRVIQVNIVEDDIPELAEQFYVILTNATLIDVPVANLGADG